MNSRLRAFGWKALASAAALPLFTPPARAADAPQVVIETLGAEARGELLKIDPESGLVLRDTTEVTLPLREVLRVGLVNTERARRPAEETSGQIELVDGSQFAYTSFAVVGESLRLALRDGVAVETTLRSTRSWRLGGWRLGGSPDQTPLSADAADVLVLRRPDGDTTPLEGAVVGLTKEGVRFEFAGQGEGPVVAPWSRVAAIALFQASGGKPPLAPVLELAVGGRVAAEGLAFDGAKVLWNGGSAPIDSVSAIDFSAGRVWQVSALKLVGKEWRPYFGVTDDDPLGGYAFDQSIGGVPLSLRFKDPHAPNLWPRVANVRQFHHGVVLRSQGELRFELPKQAGRLRGFIGLDPATHAAGSAEVSLAADGRVLWSGVVDGDTPPTTLDMPLDGARTLTLRVDYGDNLDSGDRVHFVDLRVTP